MDQSHIIGNTLYVIFRMFNKFSGIDDLATILLIVKIVSSKVCIGTDSPVGSIH